jgi:hypothetical protein
MPDEIGPHLLGRIPSPPDPRDFSYQELRELATFDPTLLDRSVRDVVADPEGPGKTYMRWILWLRWLRQNGYAPSPFDPKPKPPPGDVVWTDAILLDQGNTGHCVGFTGADFLNADPTSHQFQNDYGHELYYACKVIDGEPGEENGSWVRSIMKVLQQRKFIAVYAGLKNTDEIDAAVRHATICVGTDWTNDMFSPDSTSRVHPTGSVAGGHAYSIMGEQGDDYICLNHWGEWANHGLFLISKPEFAKLLDAQGEAWAAVEVV